jgi:hypothetical protein
VLQAKEHALTPSPSTIFTFGLAIQSIKELGGINNHKNVSIENGEKNTCKIFCERM